MRLFLLSTAIVVMMSAQEVILTPKQITDMGIMTVPLVMTTSTSQSNLPATVIVPPQNIALAAPMSDGVVQKMYVGIGDSVRQGQSVATIASSSGLTLQSEYSQLQAKWERLKVLAKKDETLWKEGIISEREFKKSQQDVSLLEIEINEKRNMMKMMGVPLTKNGPMTTTSNVTTPISGIVIEQMATLGQRLDAMSPIYKIANLSTLWLEIQTPPSVAKFVKIGDRVRTSSGAYASVIRVSSGIETANQSVLIRAKVVQGSDMLKPGQFVQVAIETPAVKSLTIPKSALVRNGDKSVVFVKSPKGFTPIAVKILKEECTTFVITGDLSGHEAIATKGIIALKGVWLSGQGETK